MGDILVKANGGTTRGAEELGFSVREGVNPAIVTALTLTPKQLQELGAYIRSEEYDSLPSTAKEGKLDEIVSSLTDDLDTPTDSEPASRFMAGTDLRTNEGRMSEFSKRMREIPGYLDTVFALHGINKEEAYNKISRMNLTDDDIYNQIANNQMPTFETAAAADREERQMRRERERAMLDISQGRDVEDASTITGKRGEPRGDVFVQRGGTRELTPEEEKDVNEALVGVKIGTGERERVLNQMGIRVNPDGKKVKILKPSQVGKEPDSDTADRGFGGIEPDIDDKSREMLQQRVAVKERADKLDRLKEQRERLQDQLSGKVILPAKVKLDGDKEFDPAEVERIRVDAQDELEEIADRGFTKLPSHLENLESFARYMGINKPQSTFSESYRIGDDGRFVPTLSPDEKDEMEQYERQMRGLKGEYERQLKQHLTTSGSDKMTEIQQRIPEYLQTLGLENMPSPGEEFALRRNRQEEVVSDMGEGKGVRQHVMRMLMSSDEHGPWWQRKAKELGFDLAQDEKFVEAMANLGVEPNDPDFPNLDSASGLLNPTRGAAFGRRVMRRPKTFSEDRPVNVDEPVDDERIDALRKRARNAAMSAIANFIQDHMGELSVEEANEHMPSYAQIAEKRLSGNERNEIQDKLNDIENKIRTEEENRRLLSDAEQALTPEGMAEIMGRQEGARLANQQRAVERSLENVAPYYVPTQAQSKFVQETSLALRSEPGKEAKDTIGEFETEERERLLQPLRDAMNYFTRLATDMQNDPSRHNLQIPTESYEDLPDTTTIVPNERGKPVIQHNMAKLESQLGAAEAAGNTEAVARIKRQIQDVRAKLKRDEANLDDPDYLKETYNVPITDYRPPIPQTRYVERQRPAADLTRRNLKNLTPAEVADHVIYMLMEDHDKAMKEGRYSIIDSFGRGFKTENEQMYRNLGYRNLVNSFEDMSAFDQRTVRLKNEIDDAQEKDLQSRTPTQITEAEPSMLGALSSPNEPEVRGLMGMEERPRTERSEVKRPNIESQIAPGTGLGVSPTDIALPSPLTPAERAMQVRGQEKERIEAEKRERGNLSTLERLRRDEEMRAQQEMGKEIVDLAGQARQQGMPPMFPLAPPQSPFSAEPPAPQVPAMAPAPAAPAPPPAPAAPAPPVSTTGLPEANDPFSQTDMPIVSRPPPQVTQQSLTLSPEQLEQIGQILNNPNLTQEQKNAMVQEIQSVTKSNPIQSFNSTRGDELLKGIRDLFWQQGY